MEGRGEIYKTEQTNIVDYVNACVNEFMSYIGVKTFPTFSIITKEMDLEKSKQQGFDSMAAAFYDVQTGTHRLEIWSKLYLPQLNAKYLVFHELTHAKVAEEAKKAEAEVVLKKLLASGMSAYEIMEKLK